MKTIAIIIIILCVMGFVIMIPFIEERQYAKTHPGFLENAYNLQAKSLKDTTEN